MTQTAYETLLLERLPATQRWENQPAGDWATADLDAAESNLPPPEIEDAGGCVMVRFRPRRYIPPERVQRTVTERQRTILALLDEAPAGLAVREIAAKLDDESTSRQVRLDLNLLKTLELAYSSGRGRGSRWRRLP